MDGVPRASLEDSGSVDTTASFLFSSVGVEQWTIFAPWFNLEYLEAASNLGLFRVRYKGKRISPKDMLDFYNKAYFRFMDKCKVNKIVIDYVQLGTMRELKSILECLVFEEL